MARADYEHWNEEADIVWYEEEGKHEIPEEGIFTSDEAIKQAVYDSFYEEDYD